MNHMVCYIIILLTKSPTPGIVMESLTGNATRFARMMLNANDPKTAVIETKWKIN